MVADHCKPRIIEHYTSEACRSGIYIFTLVLASLPFFRGELYIYLFLIKTFLPRLWKMASRKRGNKSAGSIASPSKQLLLRSVALSATLEEQQEQVLKRQKLYEAHHTKMLKIIDRLCKQDRYGHFHQPSTLKEYIENVTRPMDLGTMRKNVENHVYSKVLFLASERHKKEKGRAQATHLEHWSFSLRNFG